jgi:hypothetical protein
MKGVKRLKIESYKGKMSALGDGQARELLDALGIETLKGRSLAYSTPNACRRINQQPYLQPVDSPRTVHGRHRLGKVRLNNVNVTKEEREEDDERKAVLHQLPNIERPSEATKLITDDILVALGDQHSQPFYALVAAKVPESVIRQKLSEIKQGKVRSPAKVFTSAMKAYATAVLQKKEVSLLSSARKGLFRI